MFTIWPDRATFRTTNDKSLFHKGQKCSSGKKAKLLLTIMLCANKLCEKEKVLVISKYKNSRCFKKLDIKTSYHFTIIPTKKCGRSFLWRPGKEFGEEIDHGRSCYSWIMPHDTQMSLLKSWSWATSLWIQLPSYSPGTNASFKQLKWPTESYKLGRWRQQWIKTSQLLHQMCWKK